MARLARREHSRIELDRKLKSFHPELLPPERNELLDRLVELNLQSDLRFAEMLIRSRLFRGQGRRRIEQELRQHAIDPHDVSRFFDQAEDTESDRCFAALEKWMRGKKRPNVTRPFAFYGITWIQFFGCNRSSRRDFPLALHLT